MKKIITSIVIIAVFLIGFLVFKAFPKEESPLGSVSVTSEYTATSTTSSTGGYLATANPFVIKKGWGTLGSYIVGVAGTAGGWINFYNATTTNYLLRTGRVATSSIIMASFPADLAAGVYTLDVQFNNGLLMESTGTMGTSTITYR